MRVTITLDCGNAAFDDAPGYEVARILRQLADDAENVPGLPRQEWNGYKLRDVNGNTVGAVKVSKG